MIPFDRKFWNERYLHHQTGWDIGQVSTPIKEYVDQVNDKNISILIPGCGNAYEAEYLLQQGFTNITLIDIADEVTRTVKHKLSHYPDKQLRVITGDFFNLQGKFDLIIEQTFFCAIDPALRKAYVQKMFELLIPGGKLAGVLFNRHFEDGPPFGGTLPEYRQLFSRHFSPLHIEACYNSIPPRQGAEVFIIATKPQSQ